MIHRCPCCDEPVPWRYRLRGVMWSCGACGIRLKRFNPEPTTSETITWLSMPLAAVLLAMLFGLPSLLAIAAFVLLVFILGWAVHVARQTCVIEGPHCPACSHNLAGIVTGVCPECGHALGAAPPPRP